MSESEQQHNLLARQLRRHGDGYQVDADKWDDFLAAISEAYSATDLNQSRLERSLMISSEELLELNANLQEAAERAQTAEKAKAQFLAVMSHELRTPINGMLGMTEILSDTALNADQKVHLRSIASCTKHLLRVINDLLDFSKIEAGKLEVELGYVATLPAMDAALEVIRHTATKKDLALRLQFDSSLAGVVADASRLQQILLNLLNNAVKFTEDGEVTLAVEDVNDGAGQQRVRISVRDTGIGIAPEDMEKLFQPFTQADSSIAHRFGGTGLGLVISRRLAEAMDATLTVESEVGRGSCFSLEFLAAPPEFMRGREDEATHETTESSESTACLDCDAGRILVAEDNPLNAKIINVSLTRMGHSVKLVQNGREAVEAVEAEKFDLVLMDLMMPVMNGLEAVAEIRAAGHDEIPIIVLTASVQETLAENSAQVGADGLAVKPLPRDELAALVQRWLGKRPVAL